MDPSLKRGTEAWLNCRIASVLAQALREHLLRGPFSAVKCLGIGIISGQQKGRSHPAAPRSIFRGEDAVRPKHGPRPEESIQQQPDLLAATTLRAITAENDRGGAACGYNFI